MKPTPPPVADEPPRPRDPLPGTRLLFTSRSPTDRPEPAVGPGISPVFVEARNEPR